MTYTVAVRELCEFTAKQGDLDLRFTPAPTALEGIAGHAVAASRRGAGYRTEVDWAASAIIEFLYLEMILTRGMTAAKAAEQVAKLLPISGDRAIPGAALKPAEFRLVEPPRGR